MKLSDRPLWGGGSDQRQAWGASRAVADRAIRLKSKDGPSLGGLCQKFGPRIGGQCHCHMVVVAELGLMETADVMPMTLRGRQGAMIRFGGHDAGPVLDRLDRRGAGQCSYKQQGHPKGPRHLQNVCHGRSAHQCGLSHLVIRQGGGDSLISRLAPSPLGG